MNEDDEPEAVQSDIAIVGMAIRVPGARSLDQFWDNVRNGVVSIGDVVLTDEELLQRGVSPSDLRNPNFVRKAGVIEDVDAFDARFFGVGPRDAALMDPQHRHFQECVWEALENAGYVPDKFDGAIGVFAGCGQNEYMLNNLLSNQRMVESLGMFLLRHTSNDKDFLSSGVSYRLNLKGPSLSVQTACSTSLVAVHLAVQSLLAGECDLAIAGGVTVQVPHGTGYVFREGEVLSPDGVCRPFDARSNGTVLTSGAGVVVLKSLAAALKDGDHIHAVIKASAVNNDGSQKVSYLAPSVDGQSAVVSEALAVAGISAGSIQYVETHGTGTAVGDPIELAALAQAFRETSSDEAYCRLGSVKANVGHTDTAAGVIGLIKAALVIDNKTFPPMSNFSRPNPALQLKGSPFRISTEAEPWTNGSGPRRAGVSSLGVGGTNVHVVLEEAPAQTGSEAAQPWQVLPLSARTECALDRLSQSLAQHLSATTAPLADAAYTLQTGRAAMEHRRAVVARDAADAAGVLSGAQKRRLISGKAGETQPRVTFLFPGGGIAYPNMSRELYESEPVFRAHVDECLTLLASRLEMDIANVLYPSAENEELAAAEMSRLRVSLPAIFIVEYAMARLLMHYGVEPESMSGHSLGEYTAACIAGVMSLEDALRLVVQRALLIEDAPPGVMLSLPLSESEVQELLPSDVSLATVNSPSLSVVSGTEESITRFEEVLSQREIAGTRLPIVAAAHSHLLDPILPRFRDRLSQVKFKAPGVAFISNTSGTWADRTEVQTPEYWVSHLRQTVRFGAGMAELMTDPRRIYVEVGPGQTLSTLARHQGNRRLVSISTMGAPERTSSEIKFFYSTLARLWTEGVDIKWDALHQGERRLRVPLPAYPFERERYWIDPVARAASQAEEEPLKIADVSRWFSRPVWKQSERALRAPAGQKQRWLLLMDEHGLGHALARRLRVSGHEVIEARLGSRWHRSDAESYTISAASESDFDLLLASLISGGGLPDQIVHLWGVTEAHTQEEVDAGEQTSFYSLIRLMQAFGRQDPDHPLCLSLVTDGLQSIAGERVTSPDKALGLGAARVIQSEFANVTARAIDLHLEGHLIRRSHMDQLAASLEDELCAKPDEFLLAIRDGRRWAFGYEPVRVDEIESSSTRLKQNGVYLITGGLGAIGLSLAEHLATGYKARLVLVRRSGLPPRREWDAWLKEHREGDATSVLLNRIRAIEAAGGEVLLCTADVTNRQQMHAVVREAVARFGRIDGAFHAAGVVADGLIQTTLPEQMAAVLAPKVKGTIALSDSLAEARPDFLVLFSSTSALLGVPGQVAYAAANAFLDSFAASKSGSATEVISVDWGLWSSAAEHYVPSPSSLNANTGEESVRQQTIALEAEADWRVNEHRLSDGHAVLPGTAYLELAAQIARSELETDAIELRNVFFAAPLTVPESETVGLQLSLRREADELSFEASTGASTVHATASVRALNGQRPSLSELGLEPVASDDQGWKAEAALPSQAGLVNFGPRWQNLKAASVDGSLATGLIELSPAFVTDLEKHPLHPAVLDVAGGLSLLLAPSGQEGQGFYAPVACGTLRVWGDLPAQIVAYARSASTAESQDGLIEADVVVTDRPGNVLVEIHGLVFKRVTAFDAAFEAPADEQPTPAANLPPLLALARTDGIQTAEGMDALERMLAQWRLPQVIVSSLPLPALRKFVQGRADSAQADGVSVQRPQQASEYRAPTDAIESFLAQVWQELLGIEQVGIDDDFFDIGGHSLIALRVFARVKKEYGVELPLATLFKSSTIEGLASVLRDRVGPGAANGAAPTATDSVAVDEEWSSLVPINTNGTKTPLFCIHGMRGNVVNFRDIAIHLGADQPFYGLQARGLRPSEAPHETIEEMAETYLAEVRKVQPSGPYMFAGYSGGGLIAYEMARQLKAVGEEVSLLAFLDSVSPTLLGERSLGRRIGSLVRGLAREGPDLLAYWARRKLHYRGQRGAANGSHAAPDTSEEEESGPNLGNAFFEAQKRYTMQPLDVHVHLFRAGDRSELGPVYLPEDFGWSHFARKGVDVSIVPGKHTTLVLEPNVRVLAAQIRNAIQRAGSQQGIRR